MLAYTTDNHLINPKIIFILLMLRENVYFCFVKKIQTDNPNIIRIYL